MLRTFFVALVALALVTTGQPSASAQTAAVEQVVNLTFPVPPGTYRYSNDYTACRGTNCERRHKATDVMAATGTRVYAVVGGEVTTIPAAPHATAGYYIVIRGDDGRSYSYMHLGPKSGTAANAYAPGMARGVKVRRGQLIGYAGCTGNAVCTAPHLHFEISDPRVIDPYGTNRINPYFSLRDAERRGDFPGASSTPPPSAPSAPSAPATPSSSSGPIAGDWNGDGRSTPGWYENGRVSLRNAITSGGPNTVYSYGRAGDVPIVGDWDGDGRDSVSIIRDGTWHIKNANSSGPADSSFVYGRLTQGDLALAGDWNGSGRDTPGIVREGTWHLRNSLSSGPGDLRFTYGRVLSGDFPLVGDWNGDGRDSPAIVRNAEWHLRYTNTAGPASLTFQWGRPTDIPLAGSWNGNRTDTGGLVREGTIWYLTNEHRCCAQVTVNFTP